MWKIAIINSLLSFFCSTSTRIEFWELFYSMNFLEKNLEDIVFETPNNLLEKRGLYVFGKKIRQLRVGNYGVSDMVSFSRGYYIDSSIRSHPFLFIQIFEFKKDNINKDTFFQIIKYAHGIKRYLTRKRKFCNFKIQINLVGASFENGSFPYLFDLFNVGENTECGSCVHEVNGYTYKYDFDGISFEMICDYCLTNEGF